MKNDKTGNDAVLNSFARIKDASKSNAKWSGAMLVVQRGAIGNLTFNKIDMDVGNTIVLPIPGLSNYPVTLEQLPNTVVLSGTAHDVIEMTNKGDEQKKETLQKGEMRLLKDGVFWYATKLDEDLPHGKKAKLIAGVSEKVAATLGVLKGDQWYEAISVDRGLLKYKSWSVQPVNLENKTNHPIEVVVELASSPVKIPAHGSVAYDIADSFVSELEEDLLVFTEAKLKEHTRRLLEFREFSGSVSPNTMNTIRISLHSILQAINLETSHTMIANVINDLTIAGAPGCELDYWRERLLLVVDDLREAEVSSSIAKSTLKRLFDSSATSQVHASTESKLNKFSSQLSRSESAPFAALLQDR